MIDVFDPALLAVVLRVATPLLLAGLGILISASLSRISPDQEYLPPSLTNMTWAHPAPAMTPGANEFLIFSLADSKGVTR